MEAIMKLTEVVNDVAGSETSSLESLSRMVRLEEKISHALKVFTEIQHEGFQKQEKKINDLLAQRERDLQNITPIAFKENPVSRKDVERQNPVFNVLLAAGMISEAMKKGDVQDACDIMAIVAGEIPKIEIAEKLEEIRDAFACAYKGEFELKKRGEKHDAGFNPMDVQNAPVNHDFLRAASEFAQRQTGAAPVPVKPTVTEVTLTKEQSLLARLERAELEQTAKLSSGLNLG